MTNQTLKAIRKIKAEIRQAKREYGRGWQDHFFNNFFRQLPGGRSEAILQDLGSIVELNGEKIEKPQTYEHFYREVDMAIEEVGLDIAEIELAVKKVMSLRIEKDWKERASLIREINDKTTLVYIALRQKGYSHYDLTG